MIFMSLLTLFMPKCPFSNPKAILHILLSTCHSGSSALRPRLSATMISSPLFYSGMLCSILLLCVFFLGCIYSTLGILSFLSLYNNLGYCTNIWHSTGAAVIPFAFAGTGWDRFLDLFHVHFWDFASFVFSYFSVFLCGLSPLAVPFVVLFGAISGSSAFLVRFNLCDGICAEAWLCCASLCGAQKTIFCCHL